MESSRIRKSIGWSTAIIGVLLAATNVFAQTDAATSTTTTSSSSTMWYSQWWLWAVGIAIFLIVVIALTNRGGNKTT